MRLRGACNVWKEGLGDRDRLKINGTIPIKLLSYRKDCVGTDLVRSLQEERDISGP